LDALTLWGVEPEGADAGVGEGAGGVVVGGGGGGERLVHVDVAAPGLAVLLVREGVDAVWEGEERNRHLVSPHIGTHSLEAAR
jgi:hypothetical protein